MKKTGLSPLVPMAGLEPAASTDHVNPLALSTELHRLMCALRGWDQHLVRSTSRLFRAVSGLCQLSSVMEGGRVETAFCG